MHKYVGLLKEQKNHIPPKVTKHNLIRATSLVKISLEISFMTIDVNCKRTD